MVAASILGTSVPAMADDSPPPVVGNDSLTIEATGTTDKLKALLDVLEPYGVKELVQSGIVAIGRGPRSITDRALRSA